MKLTRIPLTKKEECQWGNDRKRYEFSHEDITAEITFLREQSGSLEKQKPDGWILIIRRLMVGNIRLQNLWFKFSNNNTVICKNYADEQNRGKYIPLDSKKSCLDSFHEEAANRIIKELPSSIRD